MPTLKRSQKIKVSQIEPNPWNPYRKKTPRLQEAIAESLAEFDQLVDIVVRPHPTKNGHYQILDGEGRFNTFDPDAEVYATVVTDISDNQAKRITLVMDETRASADKIELSALLVTLSEDMGADELLMGLPFNNSELEELLAIDSIDWNMFNDAEKPDTGTDDYSVDDSVKELRISLDADGWAKLKTARKILERDEKLPPSEDEAFSRVVGWMANYVVSEEGR